MVLRCFAALLALVCSSQAIPQAMPGETQIGHYPLVHRVTCTKVRGTAFRTGRTQMTTAAHVAAHIGCTVEGAPISIASIDGLLDAATINVPIVKIDALEISCEGFRADQWYWAAGYAGGGPQQLLVPVYAIALKHSSGMQLFMGVETFIPGMSGGPVMDSVGRVVGIVNAYNREHMMSFSRAMKDTEACNA